MDFPKSVPSVGLVDGKFVDENPASGSPGSLIPAQWGNAVSLEILNVIAAAGLVADEDDNAQLQAAISSLIATAVPAATEAAAGKAKIATTAQVTAGTDNSTVVTPLKLAQRMAGAGAVVGSLRNAKMSVTAASASAPFTADEVVVKATVGGALWCLSGFNKTINLAQTGVGGMDVGAPPASGFVSIYAIYNPTTQTAALLACNQFTSNGQVYMGANMPAGFTASALVSAWGTTAGGLLAIGLQIDRQINVALTNINSSSVNQSNTPISMAAIVPFAAREIAGLLQCGSSAASNVTMSLSGSVTGVGQRNQGASVSAGTVTQGAFSGLSLGTPATVYYTANAVSGALSSTAYLTSYTI